VAAIIASLGVIIFTWLIPDSVIALDDQQRSRGMRHVIYYYSLMTAMSGVLIWYVLPEETGAKSNHANPMQKVKDTSRHLAIWLLAVILVCAYCGYKGLDNYGLYAVQVLGMSEIESAKFTSLTAYIRPIAAISAGIIADRITSKKFITICFFVLTMSYLLLSIASPDNVSTTVIYLNLIVTFIAVFAIRGVYFALIEENGFPETGTGTAVGITSVIGFTPDIFFAPMAGRILDASPGIQGHQYYFLMLTAIAVCGMVTATWLMRTKSLTANN